MEEPLRQRLINETIQALVELILAHKFADMPHWMDFDLTVSQVKAVYLLAFRGPFTISELAGLLGVGNPAASILIQQLVQQGLVERKEDVQDRRRSLVSLTERGVDLISGRRDHREAKARRWLSMMSDDDLTGLLRGMSALAEIIRSDRVEPGQKVDRVSSGID
jgi:DNA-binding MarR family transcriptional regulator